MSKKKVVSEFTILYWSSFIAILGHMQSAGPGLDTPGCGYLNVKISQIPTNLHLHNASIVLFLNVAGCIGV